MVVSLSPALRGIASMSKAFVRHPSAVRSERTGAFPKESDRPDDIGSRLVTARNASYNRIVEVRPELRMRRREVRDGVTKRSRHVEPRLLGRGAGSPRLAPEAGRSCQLLEERVALAALLR